jgi:hypothetical protein
MVHDQPVFEVVTFPNKTVGITIESILVVGLPFVLLFPVLRNHMLEKPVFACRFVWLSS